MQFRDQLIVRRAAADDAREIAEIGVAGWRAAYRAILPAGFLAGLNAAAREIAWRVRLESDEAGGEPSWVAEREGHVLGFVASGPPRDEDVPVPAAEVYAIYVLPEMWRGGAGRAMLTTAVDDWRRRGAATMVLWVLEANSAGRAFYEAMGWQPDGTHQQVDFGAFQAPEIRYRLQLDRPRVGAAR